MRNWWRELPPNKKELVKKWLIQHQGKFYILIIFATCGIIAYYVAHLEQTPITKRKRFIAFTPKQIEELTDFEFQAQLELLKGKLLRGDHKDCKRVAKIVNQLLNGNRDLEIIYTKNWSISVVDDPRMNAFVLANGQVFVFRGMLEFCTSDEQLGNLLAHEMAHAVLGHGAELVLRVFYFF